MSTRVLSQDYDFVFKILLIGNSSVGKSSLLLRFADDVFNESFLPTIGVDFKIRTIESSGSVIKLQIWDTAGQQKFKTITSAYYKGAQGILLVFDISDRKSFNDVENWMLQSEKYASQKIVKILIGNKNDRQANREVSKQEAMRFAAGMGMEYIETSAKTNQNVENTFIKLSQSMKKEYVNERPKTNTKAPFHLSPKSPQKNCWKAWSQILKKLMNFLGIKNE